MAGYIRGIKVNCDSINSCYETTDDLICDVCNKKTESVYVLSPISGEGIKFACYKGECFLKLFKEMLLEHDDGYLKACKITDTKFTTKKTTKKKVRAELTLKLRYKILKRDNFMCVVCGRRPPEVELCVDHIKPVSKGGNNIESNLRTLCTDCNLGKGAD